MSELQIGLLILGIVIIALVIGVNEYQVWRVRKKVHHNFSHEHDDVLLNVPKNHVRDSQHQERLEPVLVDPNQDKPSIKDETQYAEQWKPLESVEQAGHPTQNTNDNQVFIKVDIAELPLIDLPWLDSELDCIADIVLNQPAALNRVPHFATARRIQVVGCTPQGRWELAQALPGIKYIAFRIGMQRVDRNGAITEQELNEFSRQVALFARGLDAEISLPPRQQQLDMAKELDQFCAEVDVMVGIHILFEEPADGASLQATLEGSNFVLEPDGVFHYMNEEDNSLYTISTYDMHPFSAQSMPQEVFSALTLLFDVPRVSGEIKTFDHALGFAHALADEFHGVLVDDNKHQLTNKGLLHIRQQLQQIYTHMQEYGIEAGDHTAQRLFS